MTQEDRRRSLFEPEHHYPKLDPHSYTARRLAHAPAEHLYITTRRCFIGPIPEGWLKSHRTEWYKHNFNYSSKTASFRADSEVSQVRRLSGLEGPSSSATYRQSFRQPADAVPEVASHAEHSGSDGGATKDGGTRTTQSGNEVTQGGDDEDGSILEGAVPLDSSTSGLSQDETERGSNTAANSHGTQDGGDTARDSTPQKQATVGLEVPKRSPRDSASRGESSRIASMTESQLGVPALDQGTQAESTKSLLQHEDPAPTSIEHTEQDSSRDKTETLVSRIKPARRFTAKKNDGDDGDDGNDGREVARKRTNLVQFAVPDDSRRAELLYKARATQMNLQRQASSFLAGKPKDGQVIKMEKMIVRVDLTADKRLSEDFDENSSQGVISQTKEKWREFMVVCRESLEEDSDFVLQMYKTRVIPAIQDPKAKKRTKYEIKLTKQQSHINLYSSLDKSIVIWTPYSRGTMIYLLHCRSSANAVEWYTFLRNILGWRRTRELQVNVPDLSVSVRIERPFKDLEAVQDLGEDGSVDENALKRTIDEEQAAAQKITRQCFQMLSKDPSWAEILDTWAQHNRIGLAWKRYDRLEWIHGANERKMYGTIAMQKSHDLELRPKIHAPTTTHGKKGKEQEEPAPVEGFLVRLTSQKGVHQRMGKLFYKRLYFSTHDRYLVFSRPAKAYPPTPPKLPDSHADEVPSAHDIAEKVPLIYAVNPYPITEDKEVSWLAHSQHHLADTKLHDEIAADEAERNLNILLDCDGFINLTDIRKVRNIELGATPADENLDEGSDVDFDEDVSDSMTDDGTTTDVDHERTFELVLRNGLVIRLQAYDTTTKKEWKKRLRELIKYWKHRTADEMGLYKSTRKKNIDLLGIDEDAEAFIGQFAKKWEVMQAYASPELYNMCGISCCRTIHMSGFLYRKPRLHSTFSLVSVILVPGHLLVFSPTLRTRSGKDIPTIHHERQHGLGLDLSTCYLYSGLLTENDLLYTNQTFDSNRPGRHGLHRWYAEDQWRVSDEDVMCTFVLWFQRRKEWLRVPGSSAVKALAASAGDTEANLPQNMAQRRGSKSDKQQDEASGGKKARLKRVSQLGVKGRSIVFKARSRAERDRWVLALSTEIDRLAGAEDVRLTGAGKDGV